MARHKNTQWSLPDPITAGEHAILAVLMDIRAELQRLNGTLHCGNFLGIPHTLNKIERNIIKPRKKPTPKILERQDII